MIQTPISALVNASIFTTVSLIPVTRPGHAFSDWRGVDRPSGGIGLNIDDRKRGPTCFRIGEIGSRAAHYGCLGVATEIEFGAHSIGMRESTKDESLGVRGHLSNEGECLS